MTNLEKGAPATLIIRAVGNRTAPTICPVRTDAEQPCQPGLESSEGLCRQSVCDSQNKVGYKSVMSRATATATCCRVNSVVILQILPWKLVWTFECFLGICVLRSWKWKCALGMEMVRAHISILCQQPSYLPRMADSKMALGLIAVCQPS